MLNIQQSHKLINHILLQAGWCPGNIQRLPEDILFQYHLSFYRQPAAYENPSHGAEHDCHCVSLKELEISPIHTRTQCCCGHVKSTPPTMDGLVSRQVIVFRLQQELNRPRILESKHIDITAGAVPPFVAISHVRMAGLGNGTRNSLPLCQAAEIQSLVDEIATKPDGNFFWIDTLCIPVEPGLKKLALQPICDIFAGAAAVIIIDPPLYQHNFGSFEEALIQIRYSNWKSRVWTLREGFVAKRLFFRFANRFISLREALDGFKRIAMRSTSFTLLKQNDIEWPTEKHSELIVPSKSLMRFFEDDVNTWLKDAPNTRVFFSYESDKVMLYSLLRIGYLSERNFRVLTENDERTHIVAASHFFQQIYGHIDLDNKRMHEDYKLGPVSLRLQGMCHLESQRQMRQQTNFSATRS